MQWLHLTAAVLGVGGIAFLVVVLLPSVRILDPEQRGVIIRIVSARFRWVTWSVILVLVGSGLYNVRQYYWNAPWGHDWNLLTVKIVLAILVFAIALALTLPFTFLNWFRARRQMWLTIALTLALIVIYISAYLRRN